MSVCSKVQPFVALLGDIGELNVFPFADVAVRQYNIGLGDSDTNALLYNI